MPSGTSVADITSPLLQPMSARTESSGVQARRLVTDGNSGSLRKD